jgi:hypothetical protein
LIFSAVISLLREAAILCSPGQPVNSTAANKKQQHIIRKGQTIEITFEDYTGRIRYGQR